MDRWQHSSHLLAFTCATGSLHRAVVWNPVTNTGTVRFRLPRQTALTDCHAVLCRRTTQIIHPWHACAVRVTVLGLCVRVCVCVCVCVCVYLSVCLHLFSPYRDQAGVIKFWGPHAIAPRPHITGRLGPPSWTWGPPYIPVCSSVRLQDGRSVRVSMPVSVFGYKTSAKYAESLMYHGGEREGKPIY